tara:strand:- start:306 stop:773 length:468 start_codon:yes stop_codon:yes gene_type:complete
MIDKDKLVTGPFGSDACYEQKFEQDGEQVTTWLCFGSGFCSSTLMTEGSKAVTDLIETAPELYKDLLHTDDEKRVWSPSTISIPAKGMVFIDGTTTKDWQWSAAKAIALTEEEISSGRYPAGQTVKMDMQNAKKYGQKDFMDALEYIGFFAIDEN